MEWQNSLGHPDTSAVFCTAVLQLAWVPCELEGLVRVAAPYVLAINWQDTGDKEMMLLQVSSWSEHMLEQCQLLPAFFFN